MTRETHEQARQKAQKRRDMAWHVDATDLFTAGCATATSRQSNPDAAAQRNCRFPPCKVCRRNDSLDWPPAGTAGMFKEARRLSQSILLLRFGGGRRPAPPFYEGNIMALTFKKAQKQQSKLRMSIAGPSGSGENVHSHCVSLPKWAAALPSLTPKGQRGEVFRSIRV